jgi:hypothetical protein
MGTLKITSVFYSSSASAPSARMTLIFALIWCVITSSAGPAFFFGTEREGASYNLEEREEDELLRPQQNLRSSNPAKIKWNTAHGGDRISNGADKPQRPQQYLRSAQPAEIQWNTGNTATDYAGLKLDPPLATDYAGLKFDPSSILVFLHTPKVAGTVVSATFTRISQALHVGSWIASSFANLVSGPGRLSMSPCEIVRAKHTQFLSDEITLPEGLMIQQLLKPCVDAKVVDFFRDPLQ